MAIAKKKVAAKKRVAKKVSKPAAKKAGKAVKKPVAKKAAASTTLNPAAAWPFPTGTRP